MYAWGVWLVDVAARWYDSPTLWGSATVIVAVLSTAILAWITYWVANPKHLLLFGMKAIPVKKIPDAIRSRMESLSHPRVFEIQVASQGRRDIPSAAFDQGIPVRLDLGAQIVESLGSTSNDTSRGYRLRFTPGETWIDIGPCLIGRRQVLSLCLLADGPQPRLSCTRRSLIDIEIRDKASERRARRWAGLTIVIWLFALIVTILLLPPAASFAAIVLLGISVSWILARRRR
jgi:hypothetical protein